MSDQQIQPATEPIAEPKRPAHRPMLPDDKRKSEIIRVRVTEEQRKRFEQLGGEVWLRGRLDGLR